nr:immunoglobulin heavy chain junction region [Macaca mulatta]MOX92338.1 immunoglobulin heavy chain junction region [Macaca mulatta]MOX93736.1 immunoglobulin heavy chain junction region [Macaca mulatta]
CARGPGCTDTYCSSAFDYW